MDNQPRVPDSNSHHRHWTWIDACSQAALSCHVLGQMATQLGEADLAVELSSELGRLIQLINEALWNDDLKFYQDVDAVGRFSRVKSVGAYWALLLPDLVPQTRLEPFIQHLRDNWAFNLPHRIPSMSADSEGYNSNSGNYWRGAVWPAANFMVLKGLRTQEKWGLAYDIGANHLENVSEVFKETQTLWENYVPERAAPGKPALPSFTGISAITPIAILLEDVLGINIDWIQRRLEWDRRLPTEACYGVRNFPLGPEGTLDLLGDPEQVTLTTDVPFTLIIRDGTQTVQAAVPAGTTEISLK